MTRLVLIIVLLIGTCLSQLDRDWSLEKMCNHYGGEFILRTSQNKPGTGDVCKNVAISFPTDTNDMARRKCEETFPYHVTAAKPGPKTICSLETGLVCKNQWIQMYGRCYFMVKKLATYPEAKKHCNGLSNSSIAYLHRDILTMHWKKYFTKVPRIWVDASDFIKNDLVYNKGDDMMLVFDGYRYKVPSRSLIRVNGAEEKAMILCEYTPTMTQEESTYLIRRYSEIYYTGFTTKKGMYIRTAKHAIIDDADRNWPIKYCVNVMKPFVTKQAVSHISGARDDVFLHQGLMSAGNQQLTYYRSAVPFAKTVTLVEKRDTPKCTGGTIAWPDDIPHDTNSTTCDGATWSFFMRMRKQGEWALSLFSDARASPIYCQAHFKTPTYGNCPTGYQKFLRPGGIHWCHKYVPTKLSQPAAKLECAKEGAELTGFETRKELEFAMYIQTSYPNYKEIKERTDYAWVGAERRTACRWGQSAAGQKGWRDDGGECSRKLIFEWVNGVSSNPLLEDLWARDYEPNYLGELENCMNIDSLTRNGLNDLRCDELLPFFCGKEAPIKIPAA